MYIRKPRLENIMLPLALLGFMGSSITYVGIVFNENTRWLFLGLLFIYLIIKKNFIRSIDLKFSIVLFCYALWCFSTAIWSDVPMLSFLKGSISISLIFVLISAGIDWVRKHPLEKTFSYFGLLTFLALLASFLGLSNPKAYVNSGVNVLMYQGYIVGANMLGTMMVMSLPFLLWKAYLSYKTKNKYFSMALLGCCIVFLLMSMSRSAILAAFLIFTCFFASYKLTSKLKFIIYGLMVSFSIIALYPPLLDSISHTILKYVYKYDMQGSKQEITSTRQTVWASSYDAAVAGGWLGLGYGVARGMTEFNLGNGLTAESYGREKGNSQFAIIEELGFIGFTLYVLLLLMIISKLMKMYITANDSQRVLVGIISGVFCGFLTMSIFEGWWTAPGSPESIYFWTLVGIIRGVEIVLNNQRTHYEYYGLETQNREGLAGNTAH